MSSNDDALSFDELNLGIDKRLDKALMKCAFVKATLVQKEALPLALAGKDILVRARTGSGKTLVYLLPLLQKILLAKSAEQVEPAIRAIILVPTRELVSQVQEQLVSLIYYCRDEIRAVALSNEKSQVQQTWLKALPDIVIATPGRLASQLKLLGKELKLRETVETFIVDEADLVFSYGYAEDVTHIVGHLARTVQSMLMSATLNSEVNSLKKLVLHDPVVVKLKETVTDGKLAQWYCSLKTDDKDLLLFALLRLKLVQGKTLFFVNSLTRAYRTKLLLEQFRVQAAVLNSELPLNSRRHILEQFNRGTIDYLIATDESVQQAILTESTSHNEHKEDGSDEESEKEENEVNSHSDAESASNDEGESEEESDEEEEPTPKQVKDKPKPQKNTKKRKRTDGEEGDVDDSAEYGVSRGIDFKDVTTVINIDMPESVASYTHRIGRTARGGAAGTALTLVCSDSPAELKMLEDIQASQGMIDNVAQPALLALDMKEIDGFRYRVEDVRGAVTNAAIKDIRLREIKKELYNSEKLKSHFDENPTDLALIRHDIALRPRKVQNHIATIPEYLMPAMFRDQQQQALRPPKVDFQSSTAGRVKWQMKKKVGKFRSKKSLQARQAKSKRKKFNNPLF